MVGGSIELTNLIEIFILYHKLSKLGKKNNTKKYMFKIIIIRKLFNVEEKRWLEGQYNIFIFFRGGGYDTCFSN